MKNKKGFTLVELMVAIAISAILAVIAVPSMVKWNKKDKFINQTREIIDTINDARAAALSDKKCPTSQNPSVAWGWQWNGSNKKVNLLCYYIDTNSGTETSEIMRSDELDDNIQVNNTGYYITSSSNLFDPSSKNIDILFSAEKERAKIIVPSLNLGDYDINKIQLTFEFTEDTNDKRTICFDRIAGFPTISKNSNCAE